MRTAKTLSGKAVRRSGVALRTMSLNSHGCRFPLQEADSRTRGRAPALDSASNGRMRLFPCVGACRPTCTLHPNDAKALAGGRLHDHPTFLARVDFGAEFLQSRHFRGNVI